MKNFKTYLLLALAGVAGACHAEAQGTAFTYQGQLEDGGAKANGSYDVTFTLYDALTGNNVLAGPLTNSAVTASNGLFTTLVDFGSGVFEGQACWLEIGVATNGSGDNFQVLSPRQPLTPVPYSIYSSDSAHAALADVASGVSSGVISVPQLGTLSAPSAGQVLGYNGAQLVWQDPVIGGNSGGWALNGNAGTTAGINYLGTSDNQPLFLDVGGSPALQLTPDTSGYSAPNLVGGSPANYVAGGIMGATIAGGGGAVAGVSNVVTAPWGTIAGGAKNLVSGQYAFVGGGYQNAASGYISTVGGGAYNTADTNESAVLGGAFNVASGIGSVVVAGGYDGVFESGNLAAGAVSFVGSGLGNNAGGDEAAVVAGGGNSASGPDAFVGGGDENSASGADLAAYSNGHGVSFLEGDSTVSGGFDNAASATAASVPGGAFNTAAGDYSLAAGFHANAATGGSFVWADASSSTNFSSSAAGQFLIRASGGVGIGTAQTPPGGLRVATGGLAVTGASSPNYAGSAGVFIEHDGAFGAVYGYDYAGLGPLALCLNSPGGNVGIGTTAPAYTLDVNGTTRTHTIIITGGSDLAEPFRMGRAEIPQGAVVVIDEEHPGQLKLSTSPYDTRVAGIVSGANGVHPGIALQQEGVLEGGQNVALSGRVYVLAEASHGTIQPGDLLTTSDQPGRAMKIADHARAAGAILGKAMTSLREGQGMVLVLVTLQ